MTESIPITPVEIAIIGEFMQGHEPSEEEIREACESLGVDFETGEIENEQEEN